LLRWRNAAKKFGKNILKNKKEDVPPGWSINNIQMSYRLVKDDFNAESLE
jgi:hypothetical protein